MSVLFFSTDQKSEFENRVHCCFGIVILVHLTLGRWRHFYFYWPYYANGVFHKFVMFPPYVSDLQPCMPSDKTS